ncbi:MAG: septum formation protein Maf [Candidatus Magasanikbacteria bacterium]|nr:septum formation protein Maf [Candidatus Magasanikbacteria bacterium]
MDKFLILASASPQRKQILDQLGIRYKAVPSHIDEHHNGLKRPFAIAKSIAVRKAEEIALSYPDQWVLGCDTFVVLSNGKFALKPKNREDAKQTLKLYRDSYCDVYSGLALVNRKGGKKKIGFEKTRLYFRDFSDRDLEEYLDSNEWEGRSGSMTIEGKGGRWVKTVKGDYWNVVGLPVNLLKKFLKEIK